MNVQLRNFPETTANKYIWMFNFETFLKRIVIFFSVCRHEIGPLLLVSIDESEIIDCFLCKKNPRVTSILSLYISDDYIIKRCYFLSVLTHNRNSFFQIVRLTSHADHQFRMPLWHA